MDTIGTILNPGLRYWQEYQEFQKARTVSVPALDKGPRPGRVRVDLDTGQVVIDPVPPNDPDKPRPPPR
jgi:hypothetical protein